MGNVALLSPADIRVIRRYVHTKYAPLPDRQRAEIVANAVRRALDQRLPELPAPMKVQLVDALIQRCVLEDWREVTPEDVADVCAVLHFPEPPFDLNAPTPTAEVAGFLPNTSVDTKLGYGRRFISFVNLHLYMRVALIAVMLLTISTFFTEKQVIEPLRDTAENEMLLDYPIPIQENKPDIGMPVHLQYEAVNDQLLKDYLNSRNSMLADDPYYSAIIDSAKKYDLHPLLLFAITGQEQGFVPKSSKNAELIANNPFNVGHSWMEYNTDIQRSSNIAAEFIAEMGNVRPEGYDPFEWFNKKYAEDPLWSIGVSKIFLMLSRLQSA